MNLIVFNLDTTADIDVDRSVIYVLREFVKYNIESELKIKVLYSNHALEMHENDFSKITASDYDMIRRQMENVSVGLFLIKNRGSNHELLQTIAEIDESSDDVKRQHFFGTIKNMCGLSEDIYEEVNGYLKELRSEVKEKISKMSVEDRLEALEEAVASLGDNFMNMGITLESILKGE